MVDANEYTIDYIFGEENTEWNIDGLDVHI